MPLYDYKCETCETVSEYLVGFKDPEPDICKCCGSIETIKRTFEKPKNNIIKRIVVEKEKLEVVPVYSDKEAEDYWSSFCGYI